MSQALQQGFNLELPGFGRSVLLSQNPSWQIDHNDYTQMYGWSGGKQAPIYGVPAPFPLMPNTEINFSADFLKRVTAVLSAFPAFKNSSENCFADFFTKNGQLQEITGHYQQVKPSSNLPPPPDSCSRWTCVTSTIFADHPAKFEIGAGRAVTVTTQGKSWNFDHLLHRELTFTFPIGFHQGFFCCLGGMVHVVDALFVLLTVLQHPKSCFSFPLYSHHHNIKPRPKVSTFEEIGYRPFPGPSLCCTKCFLRGNLGAIDREIQETSKAQWKHFKDHPALIPPQDGSSPFLLSLEHLLELLWVHLPFQLGKLMCTCKLALDFLSTSTVWKSIILTERPYLKFYWNEILKLHDVPLPKLPAKVAKAIPNYSLVLPAVSSQPQKPVVAYLRASVFSRTICDWMTPTRFLSLPFLEPNRVEFDNWSNRMAVHYYEVTCFNYCERCLKEIKDDSTWCTQHRGNWNNSYRGVGSWICCGCPEEGYGYCTNQQNPKLVPHKPISGLNQYLQQLGVSAYAYYPATKKAGEEPAPEKENPQQQGRQKEVTPEEFTQVQHFLKGWRPGDPPHLDVSVTTFVPDHRSNQACFQRSCEDTNK